LNFVTEFTKVYSNEKGNKIISNSYAVGIEIQVLEIKELK